MSPAFIFKKSVYPAISKWWTYSVVVVDDDDDDDHDYDDDHENE